MVKEWWLHNLKSGDKVLIEPAHLSLSRRLKLGVVKRVSGKFVVVTAESDLEYRYRKEDGCETGPGRSYEKTSLLEATPAAVTSYEEQCYRGVFTNKLRNLNWDDVPIDRIKQIREFVEPYIKRKEN